MWNPTRPIVCESKTGFVSTDSNIKMTGRDYTNKYLYHENLFGLVIALTKLDPSAVLPANEVLGFKVQYIL